MIAKLMRPRSPTHAGLLSSRILDGAELPGDSSAPTARMKRRQDLIHQKGESQCPHLLMTDGEMDLS
jgi:hypothetical protein